MPSRPPRRGSLWVRVELGLAAFAPALGLFAFRARCSNWSWLFLVPAAAGVFFLMMGLVVAWRGNPEPFEFDEIEDASGDVLGHIGAYLLPVLVDGSSSGEEIVVGAIVLALIIHIHIATGRIFVNPLLYLLRRRVYSASSSDAGFYLIAKSDVADWEGPRRCIRIGSSVLLEHHD